MENEYKLYSTVEKLTPQIIAEERQMYKGRMYKCDFYSGLVYHIWGFRWAIPIFAIARISLGSSSYGRAFNNGKIIRPLRTLCTDRIYTNRRTIEKKGRFK